MQIIMMCNCVFCHIGSWKFQRCSLLEASISL